MRARLENGRKKMFAAMYKRLTFANVGITIAVVLAMSGGAYAAGKYVITSTKQISPKVLKALKGNAGAKDLQGSIGPSGPAGPTGPQGPEGKAGTAGNEGAQGKDGQSVSVKEVKTSESA